jgi:hypothetical protein
MADEDDQDGDNDGSGLEEEVEIDPTGTPTRQNLPSTIIIKKRRITTTKRARKIRKETTWTQCYFNVTTMDETWSKPKEPDKLLINRLWTCKLCGPAFTSTDKQRHGNTSSLNTHMKDKHEINAQKHALGIPAKKNGVAIQPRAMDQYVVQQDPIPSAEEALLQFFALTNQPFEMIEHKSFQNIYKSVGTTCPIQSAGVLYNRQEARFNDTRKELSTELNDTCETFSISFDGWGANNHIHILAIIAHWITANWERRSIVIEFAEMTGGKSGKAMADLTWETIGPDYKKVTESIENGYIKTVTEERVGLNCAHKLFAVCGDNASPNDTFCDHLHTRLLRDYDSNPLSTSGLPRCRFRGRSSRIRCMAHIISLVVDAVLAKLKSGCYKEAIELVAQAEVQNGQFDDFDCSSLSVYQKIRTFVLWIQGSDERRAMWRKFCKIIIPLDVDTRWNALYLMMMKARENRGSFTLFARHFPEVLPLVPTDKEWRLCEVIEKCLEPFYDFTRSISNHKPSLPKSLGIIWGLDDLLDDIVNADGQFGDVRNDVRQAFQAGISVCEEYTKLVNENIMYHAAAVLDPRIKFTLIREQYRDKADEIVGRVRKYLKEEWEKQSPMVPQSEEIKLPPGSDLHHLGLLRRARKSSNWTTCDIDRYLNTEPIEWDATDESNYDPDWVLKWWRANAFQFPYMAAAARALLAVPASEVDVERLFSGGRDLLGIRRYALKGETMRILTLLKSYFERALNKGTAILPEVSIASLFPNRVIEN